MKKIFSAFFALLMLFGICSLPSVADTEKSVSSGIVREHMVCGEDTSLRLFSEDEKEDILDENGHIIISSVETSGFTSFGAINAPENVLDMDETTYTGSDYNGGAEQSVTAHFKGRVLIGSVFVQCKEEGSTTNPDGHTRGTYRIYAYDGNAEIELGDLPAVTGTDGGALLRLDEPIYADSVKIVIAFWEGDCWACVADLYVTGPLDDTDDPSPSEEDPTEESPSEEDPTVETPSEEVPSDVSTPSPVDPSTETPTGENSETNGQVTNETTSSDIPDGTTTKEQDSSVSGDGSEIDPAKAPKTGLIIGCVVGGVLLAAAIAAAVILVVKKRKTQK